MAHPLASRLVSRVAQVLQEDHDIDPEAFEALTRAVGKPGDVHFGEENFVIGKEWRHWLVFDFFEGPGQDDVGAYISGDARIYLFPATQGAPFMIVTVNTARTTKRLFDEDGFVARCAAEWSAVAESLSVEDDEYEEESKVCPACKAENWQLLPLQPDASEGDEEGPEAAFCAKCGATLTEVVSGS
jgi:hypothetical protein